MFSRVKTACMLRRVLAQVLCLCLWPFRMRACHYLALFSSPWREVITLGNVPKSWHSLHIRTYTTLAFTPALNVYVAATELHHSTVDSVSSGIHILVTTFLKGLRWLCSPSSPRSLAWDPSGPIYIRWEAEMGVFCVFWFHQPKLYACPAYTDSQMSQEWPCGWTWTWAESYKAQFYNYVYRSCNIPWRWVWYRHYNIIYTKPSILSDLFTCHRERTCELSSLNIDISWDPWYGCDRAWHDMIWLCTWANTSLLQQITLVLFTLGFKMYLGQSGHHHNTAEHFFSDFDTAYVSTSRRSKVPKHSYDKSIKAATYHHFVLQPHTLALLSIFFGSRCSQNNHRVLHWWRIFLLRPLSQTHQGALAFTLQKVCGHMRPWPHRQVFWVNASRMHRGSHLRSHFALSNCDQIAKGTF